MGRCRPGLCVKYFLSFPRSRWFLNNKIYSYLYHKKPFGTWQFGKNWCFGQVKSKHKFSGERSNLGGLREDSFCINFGPLSVPLYNIHTFRWLVFLYVSSYDLEVIGTPRSILVSSTSAPILLESSISWVVLGYQVFRKDRKNCLR